MTGGCADNVTVGRGGGGGDSFPDDPDEPAHPTRMLLQTLNNRISHSLRMELLFMAVFGRKKKLQSCLWPV
jgi:hypothetical protein